MRIVHIEDVFFPEAGYQINILSKYLVKFGHEVIIVTSEITKIPSYLSDFFGKENIPKRDDVFEKETGVRIIRVPIYKYYSGRSIYKLGFFRLIDTLKPDVLFAHGEDTYAGLRIAWRLGHISYPVIFDDHMVDIASVNRFAPAFRWFYRNFVTPHLLKHNSIVIRTMNDDFVFRRYGIPLKQAPLIETGSDIIEFHPDSDVKRSVRQRLGIALDDFVFIYAGKLDESKGGHLLANALREILPVNKQVSFLIVGTPLGKYGEEFSKIIESSQNKIYMVPTQPYSSLSLYFKCSDVALFPKQCSLSYYDAQACGLPVILEDFSVNKLRITHNNGFLFEPDDVNGFRSRMIEIASLSTEKFVTMKRDSMDYILENYNYENISKQYLEYITKAYLNWYK